MKFRQFRLQNAEGGEGSAGGAAAATTLMTDGVNTTPAGGSSASTEATGTPAATVDATQQPSTDKAETTEAKTDAEAKPPERVVPDKYEFTAPEGVTLDAEALGEFEGMAKELKLTQEEAQKVADIGPKMMAKWQAKQAEAIQTAAAEWAATATADKEYGGEKLTESLATAKKALTAFGTPELQTLLNDSRLGNHPEVIRFMVRAGKAISEDRMVTGGAGPSGSIPATAAQRMYPSMNP